MARTAVRPIRNKREYEASLDEIKRYFENEPAPGTPEADRCDLLALVIEDYEKKNWPVDAPDPVEAIRYRMETGGFSQADLGRLLGSRQRASDILGRRRPLTLEMAWKLHRQWNIPAEVLIKPQMPASPRGRRIPSSAIHGIRYNALRKKLFVTFVSGREYVYEQVPKWVFEEFDAAASKGSYFNRKIPDNYNFYEVLAA